MKKLIYCKLFIGILVIKQLILGQLGGADDGGEACTVPHTGHILAVVIGNGDGGRGCVGGIVGQNLFVVTAVGVFHTNAVNLGIDGEDEVFVPHEEHG